MSSGNPAGGAASRPKPGAARGHFGSAPEGSPADSAPPELEPGTVLVSDSVSLIDSVLEYISARLRLEGYRFERDALAALGHVLLKLGAGVLAVIGLIFVSIGVANLISQSLGLPSSGLLIVGGVYLLGSVIALAIVSARARSHSRKRSL